MKIVFISYRLRADKSLKNNAEMKKNSMKNNTNNTEIKDVFKAISELIKYEKKTKRLKNCANIKTKMFKNPY